MRVINRTRRDQEYLDPDPDGSHQSILCSSRLCKTPNEIFQLDSVVPRKERNTALIFCVQ
jgi:hypothetical protein